MGTTALRIPQFVPFPPEAGLPKSNPKYLDSAYNDNFTTSSNSHTGCFEGNDKSKDGS